jgi:transglutaminase-like putative cysteine protease
VLFLFVPRIEGRFWALPAAAPRHTTGIGEEMSPGDVAQLGLSDDPAFRAWFTGAPPPAERRYWRVLVLEEFDGRKWRRYSTSADLGVPEIVPGSVSYDYRIVLEPTNREWLAGLDTVVGWPSAETFRSRATTLVRIDPRIAERLPVTAPFSYSLLSVVDAAVMPSALPRDLARRNLQLPDGRSPRARALAQELRAQSRDERDYVAKVLERFRHEAFEYTLEPPPLGAEPVDEFLFATRQGFCEHYASAFAVLMRAAGIPARVVTGYQGGEPNAYGGYLLVRQSSAHAWNEVWLAGTGWLRVDPTAAVAPDRIRRGSLPRQFAGDAGERLFGDLAWLGRARALWDAGRTAWYEAVVNFDPSRQQRLLERIGLGERSWQGLAIALATGFALAALALAAWLAWELRPRNRDPLVAGWDALCARLERAGVPRAPAEGPLDYSRRVAAALPAFAATIDAVADSYVTARYLPGATAADAARFQALARELRRRLRAVRP